MNARVAPTQIQRVVGIDMSLTSTGIGMCVRTLRGVHMAGSTIKSTPAKTGLGRDGKPRESLADRMARQRQIADEVRHYVRTADLVIIEGMVTAATPGGKVLDRGALWWRIVDTALRHEIPVGVVMPTTVKKAITDDGKADKVKVASHLQQLYPELVMNSSDEADAMAMAHIGAVLLDWPVKTLIRHQMVKWTDHPGELAFSPIEPSVAG